MKKSVFYISISVSALVVLIGIQVFSLLRIYSLEQEKFDYRFREIITGGIAKLESISPELIFKTAYLALERDSYQSLKTYYSIDDTTLLTGFRKYSFNKIRERLIKEQGLETVIEKLLESNGEKTEFDTHFRISSLSFFKYPDTVNIYNEEFDTDWDYTSNLNIPKRAVLISPYSYEGTFFKISFDTYVDFINKRRMVLGQMLGILIIMFLALIIVSSVFVITVRNMMEEKRLSQLKTDFINNMTHELKTPLSTIAIATKTMGSPGVIEDKEKVSAMTEMIGRQNRYLSKQINHLLEVSMWEKGQFELEPREFELKPFLVALAEAFRWERKDCKLTLIEEYDRIDGLMVRWDETQMTMALHNLLVNGSKYNNGEPVIHLRARKEHGLVIEVQDNGIGISKDQLKHIFDKFYRIHTGNIHKVKGLGLGLFYVRQIVLAHKGEVLVKSKKNAGSTFILKIPHHG